MIRRVAVVVPAANEQARIAACLAAIERSRRRLLEGDAQVERVDVIVVLDACSDRTPEIVDRFAAKHPLHIVRSEARRVGAARRRGALRAIGTAGPAERLWLANTDADSTVPVDWLTAMIAAADAGAGLVLGTVVPGAELPPALRAAWLARHHLREDHSHVHGANLGIRADTYLAAGGWDGDAARNEDVDLAQRASAIAGVRTVRTAAIPVTTSARMLGQAPDGFSSYLRHLRDGHTAVDRLTRSRRRLPAPTTGRTRAGHSGSTPTAPGNSSTEAPRPG